MKKPHLHKPHVPPPLPPVVRYAVLGLGWFSLVLGLIGVVLPLVPTTPFLLLTAFCFARTSARFHDWLVNHHLLGPPIRRWREKRGIALRDKIVILLISVVLTGVYAIWFVPWLAAKIVMISIALAMIVLVVRTPTAKPGE